MTECFVYDTVRTPRGKGRKDGALHEVTALELGTPGAAATSATATISTPSKVDDVIFGCVDPVGEQGSNIARIAVLNADYAESVAGVQINRFCASGLEACNMAAGQIMAGQSDMTIGGGVESMSRVGMGASGGAWATDPAIAIKSYFSPQGIGADLIATLDGFSRDDVDAYSVESQKRAANAWKNGYFKKSVTPVKDINGLTILDRDEHMRPDTTMQSLASLQPAFAMPGEFAFDAVAMQRYPEVEQINHVHHAGNSSGIVDGAAAVLMGTKEAGKAAGLKPRARIRAFASIGSEPSIMLTGPSYVTEKVLKRAGMKVEGHRPLRAQRGVRFGRAALHEGAQHPAREGQRERRRDRDGPSARRDRRDDPGHRARRARAAQSEHGARHAVRRRRHGHGHHHRTRLSDPRRRNTKMELKTFKWNQDGDGIVTLTWDDPERTMNVLSGEALRDIGAAMPKIASDAAIKGAIITSGKANGFCAGAALDEMEGAAVGRAVRRRREEERVRAALRRHGAVQQLFRKLETCGKPIVAAINGLALGGGLEVTLACHYRVVADNPKIQLGLPESKVGLVARRRRHAASAAPDRRAECAAADHAGHVARSADGARRRRSCTRSCRPIS